MVDAGSEPTYAEKNRVPPPGACKNSPIELHKFQFGSQC